MPTEAWLGALGVLELDNWSVLDRLLTDAKHARRHLSDYIIPVWDQLVRIASFSGAHVGPQPLCRTCTSNHEVQADRAKGHSTTIDRQWNPQLCALFSAVERN